jgi:hypothetical protein
MTMVGTRPAFTALLRRRACSAAASRLDSRVCTAALRSLNCAYTCSNSGLRGPTRVCLLRALVLTKYS